MKIALCGLPFTGKSTVFKAVVGKTTQAKSACSGKIQLNIGTLELKDERLQKLGELLQSEKITYPKINLVDLAHSSESAQKGLETSYIREFDCLALVIAVFSSPNPAGDLINILAEFILADLELVQSRITRLNKERKAKPKKEADSELALLERCQQALEQEQLIQDLELSVEELKVLAGFQLLTLKPMLVIANISEEQLNNGKAKSLKDQSRERGLSFFAICAKLEAEIEELPEKEQAVFMREMGLNGLSRDKFIELCFQVKKQILFFTVVGKEARAWPLACGATALEAAGAVHSDMQRGFIRAEAINYQDFINCGSFAQAKERGLLRLEGKDYLVQDGDIINFKFSV
ncbi:MAG: redox-regulated ATPase YchF [Candidatus Omnitrophica bacterium]|nr:redox-regulated ATPase YchF [Candidatus Omnitrophota bacterium]